MYVKTSPRAKYSLLTGFGFPHHILQDFCVFAPPTGPQDIGNSEVCPFCPLRHLRLFFFGLVLPRQNLSIAAVRSAQSNTLLRFCKQLLKIIFLKIDHRSRVVHKTAEQRQSYSWRNNHCRIFLENRWGLVIIWAQSLIWIIIRFLRSVVWIWRLYKTQHPLWRLRRVSNSSDHYK